MAPVTLLGALVLLLLAQVTLSLGAGSAAVGAGHPFFGAGPKKWKDRRQPARDLLPITLTAIPTSSPRAVRKGTKTKSSKNGHVFFEKLGTESPFYSN